MFNLSNYTMRINLKFLLTHDGIALWNPDKIILRRLFGFFLKDIA